MGTFIVGAVIITIVVAIISNMVRDRKQGKSVICGGDCKHCGGHCNIK